MAISDVANALVSVGSISAHDVALVDATNTAGQWTVNSEVIWEGGRGHPPTWGFESNIVNDPTNTSINVVQITNFGTTTPVTEQILAYDGTNVLLGQPDGSGGFTSFFLVADTSLGPNNSGPPGYYPITDLGTSGPYTAPPPACYVAGTRIRTARGEVAVEDLIEGDLALVQTADGLVEKPVIWVGRRRVNLLTHPEPEAAQPIRIRRDAFAAGQPSRDLLVSPDHAIFVDGMLVPAKLLVNGGSIAQERRLPSVVYYHVELEQHSVLLAENLPAESYLDTGNRSIFENAPGPVTIHPDFSLAADARRRDESCAPFMVSPRVVQPIWQRLRQRAGELGYQDPELATTDSPQLRLRVGARDVTPSMAADGHYWFVVPGSARMVRLVSRAAKASAARPWINDARRLGVSVGRIVIREGAGWTEIPIRDPALRDGWWRVEADGAATWRWTGGDAGLELPAGNSDLRVLKICLTQPMLYPIESEQAAPVASRFTA